MFCVILIDYIVSRKTSESRPSEHHHEDKKTLIIVSGTTGAILGALIILVVIVSCQRRLHYHRLRRARLRCRQDQDAFAAFIAYSRDVRFMLPSYDEAMNQRGQGQPPTFDEAIADNGQYSPAGTPPSAENSPSSTASHPTHPAVSQCSSTPTSTPTESETVEVDDSVNLQVTPSRGANGRFLRALRVLFGGWTFASRAMYCQLVPQVNFEGANANEGPETEQPSLTDSRRELDETLVRAGLC